MNLSPSDPPSNSLTPSAEQPPAGSPRSRFEPQFFERHAVAVARDLLGARLFRVSGGQVISGIITETEAYQGEEDLACHARAGRTPRTAIMYGPPGRAYIYFTYGMHWLLNVVTGPVDTPAAVLIRSIHPLEGMGLIAARRNHKRPVPSASWTNGPAKLTQALAVDGALNGIDLLAPNGVLWIEPGSPVPDEHVQTSARIGLFKTPEPWKSIPWRFAVKPGIMV